jgi:polar amino acid transport system substrate-binding protein
MKRSCTVLLVACLAALVGVAEAADEKKTVAVATLVWEPYVGPKLKNGGMATEIVVAAFKRAGIKATIHHMPWIDVMNRSAKGEVDAIYPAYFSKERLKKYLISEPFLNGPLALCARKATKVKFDSLEDLKPYRIGVVEGYANEEKFDAADYLTKVVAKSDLANLRSLIKGDVDLAVVDQLVGLHLLKKHREELGGPEAVKFLVPPLGTRDMYVMFPRILPESEARLKQFNRALLRMKKVRRIEQIMKKHGFK